MGELPSQVIWHTFPPGTTVSSALLPLFLYFPFHYRFGRCQGAQSAHSLSSVFSCLDLTAALF